MSNNPRVGFISLGCPKALVDSERILTQLRMEGYDVVSTYQDADVVVVNTCGFIDSAKAESLEVIGEAIKENGKVIVTGCMGVEEGNIRNVHPSVLAVTGPQQYEQVVNAVHQVVPPRQDHNPLIDLVPPQGIKLTPRHYAYLKISEGCNHSCSFCIIPSMRGKLVSRPVGDVLDEAQRLVKSGVKELLVISQDTSAYGVDVKYRTGFWNGAPVKTRMTELCEALSSLGVWVRLHYVYPYPHVDELIPLMAAGKILPYLDIPFQHASPKVLKSMKRPAFEDKTLARIKNWRVICPDLIIRSTFIVGFPGETEEDFQYLLDWLSEAQLDRVGCFQYSPVEGAPANDLDLDIVPDDIKQDRWDRFMAHQQAISAARLQMKIGKDIEVLIDEVDEQGAVGRCFFDAPEIDGNVFIATDKDIKPGDKIMCRVTDADEYDLWAEVI
ncbi:30S ribosomal protein S12 methylthiotransferase RimO [Pseudomonas weihenstephanensis]|uniref:Ribosomal protein uS12 methylthiotransferase RimO n=1 Tax=Pseudomonas weihenstephanensis TaxID=1608994 RepID=A0A0J6IU83_9PSED|nr:30S ribosomal protein S12 methylthiotransferase RimO [Pseudomonas weihenstephanensis]KMN15704.1 ribosomal protein S12 methylthiotransferase [Pseudomonas weihenstephanensis]MBM1190166.1 30S ribosomal protein S12 methylthiotransferase RimO [Pseudomonas weihenstephanensis]MBM1194725.1 30S ribosomal protein S12 methylthiotransferase RimO [Pseudomonas weihenstephanensis]